MSTRFIKLVFGGAFLTLAIVLTQVTFAQTPVPPKIRENYNYAESYSCTRCHFVYGARGDHNLEAVGVMYDDAAKAWIFTGGGWLASQHSQSSYTSTDNTYCAKCHSPLQAKPEAEYRKGVFTNTVQIPLGTVEGITCAACHPSHTSAAILGRRLGIYQIGMDKTKPEAYKVIHEGQEDELCLNCHLERHNEGNAAFELMYVAGVRCIDCHMAPYGRNFDDTIDKRFHDFKVARNLPYSCGVQGSMVHCHPEFGVESTMALIPVLKQQHRDWMPEKRRLRTAADYLRYWKNLEAEYK